jgi:hypothetical protein
MTFYSEATMLQSLALLERIFQASWEMHLLFSTACGLPNRDITRPDHISGIPPAGSFLDPTDTIFLISVLIFKSLGFTFKFLAPVFPWHIGILGTLES